MILKTFAENIWISDASLKFYGVQLGCRMTVIDLDGKGNLFIHSPIKLNEFLKSQIDSIGVVRYVVAPNRWHHLHVNDFKTAYPNAKFYCAPGLEKKRPDFKFNEIISEQQTLPWNPYLEHTLVDGVPFFNEVVFLHKSSKTLVVTDLATNIQKVRDPFSFFILSALRAYKKFGWSNIEQLIYIKDQKKFKKSTETILSWDFQRIILSHGQPVLTSGKKILSNFFSKT
jgi:hypothetical protein